MEFWWEVLAGGEQVKTVPLSSSVSGLQFVSGVTLNLPGPGRFSVLRECKEVWRQRERLEVFLQEEKM